MENKSIIDENFPETLINFMGEEIYFVQEKKHYEAIKSEGQNQYRFLNLIQNPNQEFLSTENKDFFFKMINAIKTDKFQMDGDGYALVNIENYPGIQWENLEKIFSPSYCILWGVDPNLIGIQCQHNYGVVKNNCRIIYVDSISTIMNDVVLKRKLWQLVQNLFQMPKS